MSQQHWYAFLSITSVTKTAYSLTPCSKVVIAIRWQDNRNSFSNRIQADITNVSEIFKDFHADCCWAFGYPDQRVNGIKKSAPIKCDYHTLSVISSNEVIILLIWSLTWQNTAPDTWPEFTQQIPGEWWMIRSVTAAVMLAAWTKSFQCRRRSAIRCRSPN